MLVTWMVWVGDFFGFYVFFCVFFLQVNEKKLEQVKPNLLRFEMVDLKKSTRSDFSA